EGSQLSDKALATLAQRMPNLVSLSLDGAPLGDAGARALASCQLPRLEHLSLIGCGIGPDGARALLDAPELAHVPHMALGPDEGPEAPAGLDERSRRAEPFCALSS